MFSAIKQTFSWLRHSSIIRITVLMSFLFTLVLFTVGVITLLLVQRQTLAQTDAELIDSIAQFEASNFSDASSAAIVLTVKAGAELPPPFDRIGRNEKRYYTPHEFEDKGGNDWRVLIKKTDNNERIFSAISLEDRDRILELISGVFSITAVIALFALFTLAVWHARRTQQRLNTIGSTLSQLAAGNLGTRTHIKRQKDDIDVLARSLDQTADKLELLMHQTRNLSANIAHDLRTPLARLAVNLEQLAGGDEQALDRAHSEVEQLTNTFNAIMRIARIESQVDRQHFTDVSLPELVTSVADIYEPVAEDKGKTLITNIKGASLVRADHDLLVQALANLIQNALVYGGDSIELFCEQERIGVVDNGDGIAPELYAKVIQPMTRLDTTRQSDGAGLGLAMVKAIADVHDAELVLKPAQPKGLKIYLDFSASEPI